VIKKIFVRSVLAALLLAPAAHAQLQRVGPVNQANGYPAWYQDKTGITLEFCSPVNQAELNLGWCTILPADVPTGAAPEAFPARFSDEHFYFIANAGTTATQGGTGLVLALEGAFATGGPVAGDQIVFGRIRIRIASVPLPGDYKIYTPFGDYSFPGLQQGQRLFFTSDIGIGCGASFDCALNSAIGPFLLPSATSGGPEMLPVTQANQNPGGLAAPTAFPTGSGKSYIADPARVGPVTGSPLPPFVSAVDGLTYNHNRFRIEGPGGVMVDEPNFTLGGRLMEGTIPGQVSVKRASYSQSTIAANKLDVFATAFPTTQGRLPAGAIPPAANPDLGFYDTPCATDPLTGALAAPVAAAGLPPFLYYQMLHNLGSYNWWGGNAPLVIPPQVCVQDLNAKDAAGNFTPAFFQGDVTDEVDITTRNWNPLVNGGTLTVAAASSDQVNAPTLTVEGYGPLVGGQLLVPNLAGPPSKVVVVSTRGGVAQLDVRTGVGQPVSPTNPVAAADSVTTPEDTVKTAINVLANDTLNTGPIPAGATVAISAQGRLGTAAFNADNTITYTPNLNVNGTDIVGYTVTANGFQSNEGYLTVIITPLNDAPTAVNDATGAANNKAVTINVLSNDTDPDGAADLVGGLAAAVIQTLPAAAATITCNGGAPATAGMACAGGLITITPAAPGAFSLSYFARDRAGVQSTNAANVSVTVNSTENIVVTKSIFTAKVWRMTVAGTDNIPQGQTLTINYDITTPPTYKVSGVCTAMTAATNPVIGTAVVDNLGNWTYDVLGTSAGPTNPTNTGSNGTGYWCSPPKTLRITSPLGATASSNISLK
jgi:hypothetical protein